MITHRWRVSRVAFTAAAFLSLAVLQAAGMDVHEFESNLAQYVGQQVQVEGRFRSAGAGKLFLIDSPIEFQLGRFAGQVRRSMRGVAIEGQLIQDGKKPVFRVDNFRALPTDTQRFADMRARITPGNSASLFSLAHWARRQAHWYHDRALEQLASEAYRQAFDWAAERATELNNVDQLLFLAAWGEGAGLPTAISDQLRHRACLILVARVPAGDAKANLAAAARIRQLLRGTTEPLGEDRHQWSTQYLADPETLYPELTPQERREAARALWARSTAAAIELQGAGLSGTELEDLIARAMREIPDRPDTVRQLRLAAVKQQATGAANLSRAELLRLRDELTSLDEQAMAHAVVERWLLARRSRLNAEDAEGRSLLATEYRALLADRQTAAMLLLEALKIAPELTDASEALAELGYTLRNGTWVPTTSVPGEPGAQGASDLETPLAAGVPEATVLARLRRPDRIARVGTQNAISEQWIYEGPPRLHIFLRRSTVTGQAYVTRIEGAP